MSMSRGRGRLLTLIVTMALIVLVATISTSAVFGAGGGKNPDGGFVSGHYIVSLKAGISPSDVTRKHGVTPAHVYSAALNGFAAPLSPGQVNDLRTDPDVQGVEPDFYVSVFPGPNGPPPGKGKKDGGKEPSAPPPSQVLPTGVDRVDADLNDNTALGIDVAIIDTGIDLDHPDLNVVGSVNFTKEKNADDKNGHGSHVAGTVGANDNEFGVVGVAPGVSLWAVKVLNRRGSGSLSGVIAGVDWVTANAGTIEVANMSLGFKGTSNALDTAIANSVNAGVVYVVAAGNSSEDASSFSPANHPDVITVSAITDTDGRGGGLGPDTFFGADDTFASFSNFGPLVELTAPGVNILSAWKDAGYETISGTSMASPHVAGGAALYVATNPDASPADVRTALIAGGTSQHGSNGFTGDPDHNTHPSSLDEPLVNASGL